MKQAYVPHHTINEAVRPSPNPYRDAPSNIVGKVVARHKDGTVDVSLGYGGFLPNVPVGSPFLSSDSGEFYIPKNDLATTPSHPNNYEPPAPAEGRNIYCVVEFATQPFGKNPHSRQPFIRTFLPPSNNQMIGEEGLYFKGHESGVQETIDTGGNMQIRFADGSWLSIGPTTTLKDMSAVNSNYKAPSGGQAVNLIFTHSSGKTITMTSSGAVEINGKEVAVVGGTVDTTTGAITGSGQ